MARSAGREGRRHAHRWFTVPARILVIATLLAAVPMVGEAAPGGTPSGAGLASTPPDATADWTQFRFGPKHHAENREETQLSPSTVHGLRAAWSTPLHTAVFSSPAVAGGTVYVGGLDGKLFALDGTSGAVAWSVPPDALDGDTVWTSPAISHGSVFFAANRPSATVYAVDAATGATRWTASPTISVIIGSPTVVGKTLYVGLNDGGVLALDVSNGHTRWEAQTGATIYSSPAVSGGRLFVGVNDHTLRAFDTRSGAPLWTAQTGGIEWSSPAVSHGTVFIGSRDGDSLQAFDAATGKPKWTFHADDWVQSSPAVSDNTVFFGSNDGSLYALDASTGARRWAANVGGIVFSSPAVANGVVYVGSGHGSLMAFDAVSGQRLFSAKIGDVVNSSPVVSNGRVYLGAYDGDGNVVSFVLPGA
jgi:eukaryotic-like serine/threonine-protein kinase